MVYSASYCKMGNIINLSVSHIHQTVLCTIFVVYWRNNYHRYVENSFIVQFYFLNTVSEGRLVYILNGECKVVIRFLFILSSTIYVSHPIHSVSSCIVFWLLLPATSSPLSPCPYLWNFHLFMFILTVLLILGLCNYIKFMFCHQWSFLSLWCCTLAWHYAVFWVPTGNWKMKVGRTILTALYGVQVV